MRHKKNNPHKYPKFFWMVFYVDILYWTDSMAG